MAPRFPQRSPAKLILAMIALAIGVLATGLWSYQHYESDFRQSTRGRLMAIAELKAAELQGWRAERMADAAFYLENKAFISLLQRLKVPGQDRRATDEIEDWIGRMQRNHQYDRISVHGVDGLELLAVPDVSVEETGHMRNEILATFQTGATTFLDAHPDESGKVHMAVVAPVLVAADSSVTWPMGRPVGAVVLRIDPVTVLEPMVARWPVPSPSSETLIVRLEGDEVVYLTAPKAEPLGPLAVRRPISRRELAAVMAVSGTTGVVEAEDSGGGEVLAALLPIPDSPWFLVARTATGELFGPLRDRAWMTATVVMALLSLAVVGGVLLWRRQRRETETLERDHGEALAAMAHVVEASSVVVFRWSATPGWPVAWVSANVARWGYSAEALIAGDPEFKALIHPDDEARVRDEVNRFTRDGRDEFTQDYRVLTRDGRIIWVEDRTTVVRNDEGGVQWYEGVLADVTERRELQEQFVQAQKMEIVGRLAGGVAHDFNNLLTVINGYAEFALAEVPHDLPLREMIQEIHDAGTRASALTGQLLAFSRRQVISPTVLDLNQVAERMQRMLSRLIGEDIELVFDLAPDAWPARADAGLVEQVLMNLAINARDAMPEGGTLRVATRNARLPDDGPPTLPALPGGEYVRLTVADSGCGMTPEVQARVFEPFFTTKAPGSGTGLGLSTVQRLVADMAGGLRLTSSVNVGTTFDVLLPHATVTASPAAPLTEREGVVRGVETVLLVEDEVALRGVAERVLTSAGYRVIQAGTGDEALQQLRAGQMVDLLFSDVVMPGMGGYDLAERVSHEFPSVAILLASGYIGDRVVDTGRWQFLAKPYSPGTLTRRVRDVLDQRPG